MATGRHGAWPRGYAADPAFSAGFSPISAQRLTTNRYLAGGAALHFAPNSIRCSDDLDFFHDSEARVAAAFAADSTRLGSLGYRVDVELSLPGFVRAIVARREEATRIDWAHDSAWRFMPLVRDTLGGLLLHPVDLAVNKVLALAGRDEARDFVDILFVHDRVLALPALTWAAPGKDPGFSPLSLLELPKRRGKFQPEEVARLQLAAPFDLIEAKAAWLAALAAAEAFANERPPEETGCLYYSHRDERFVVPRAGIGLTEPGVSPHYSVPAASCRALPVRPWRLSDTRRAIAEAQCAGPAVLREGCQPRAHPDIGSSSGGSAVDLRYDLRKDGVRGIVPCSTQAPAKC